MKNTSTTIKLIKTKVITKPMIAIIIFIVLFSLFSVFLSTLTPLVYKYLIDDIIPKGESFTMIIFISLLVLIPIIALAISFLRDKFIYIFSNNLSEDIRRTAYKSCLQMEYSDFEKMGYQKAIKTITREIGRICELYIGGELFLIINNVLQLISISIILATLSYKLLLVNILLIPFIFIVMNIGKKSVTKKEKKLMFILSKCDNYLTHVFKGIKSVKSLNAMDYEVKEFDEWLSDNKKVNWKIKSSHSMYRTILPNIINQIAYGIMLALAAYFVGQNDITMGTLVAAVAYIPTLFSSISSLLGTGIGYAAIKNSIESVDLVLDAKKEEGKLNDISNEEIAVSINNLNFSYSRGDFKLNIDNFGICNNEFIAVVGESGSGKSSLIDVLSKYYTQEENKVKIYGNDINKIDPNFLRTIIHLNSQEVFLWNKSIIENIIYPSRLTDINIKLFNECIIKSSLKEFINSLQEKEYTVLGDFGSQISGGEKQRIALARALYNDFKLLILDEPTSALDSINAKILFDTILEQKSLGKTIILITHDLKKAMYTDKIAVVKFGKIIEFDTPNALNKQGTYFHIMYEAFNI